MKADQIWKIDHLREKVAEAGMKMRMQGSLACRDGDASSFCMVEVLAPAGYHQIQGIADAFGLDFDGEFSNEYEWDRFRREIHDLKARVEQELRPRLELPEGIFFCLGYDPEGNFGIILRLGDKKFGKGRQAFGNIGG